MIGILRPREVGLMATVAIGRQRCVVVVHVAGRAGHALVGSGQRECGLVVIEHRAIPGSGGVAGRAGGREAGRYMIRVSRPGEVGLVSTVAIGRKGGVVVVDVAGRAGHGLMRAGQRERRLVVIENRAIPGRGRVASRAGGREAG